jgi:hypothetical protein
MLTGATALRKGPTASDPEPAAGAGDGVHGAAARHHLHGEGALMVFGAIRKQPPETFLVGIDFKNYLGVDETIVTPTVTAKNLATGANSSGDVLGDVPVVTGNQVTQRIVGGADGERHRIQFRVTTSAANVYEGELDVSVVEV